MTKKKAKRGRPPTGLPTADRQFNMRLRADQEERYKKAAVRAGLSLAEWLKKLADEAS